MTPDNRSVFMNGCFFDGVDIPRQFITKFRLQRSVSDAGSKPIEDHLTIGFAFVFNVCKTFPTLIVEG